MKNTILILTLFVGIVTAKAQFTYRVINKHVSGSSASFELIGYGYVKNTGTVKDTFVWKLNKSMILNGWGSTLCDKNLCYDTAIYSSSFELEAGDSGVLNLYIYPNKIAGSGGLGITIHKLSDSSNAIKDTIYYDTWTVGVEHFEAESSILLYPNPAGNRLYVEHKNLKPGQVKIFNVLGQLQQVISYDATKNGIDVSILSSGVYTLSYTDEAGKTVFKKFQKL